LVGYGIWYNTVFARIRYLVAYGIWENTVFGRIRYLVEYGIWENTVFGRIRYSVEYGVTGCDLWARVKGLKCGAWAFLKNWLGLDTVVYWGRRVVNRALGLNASVCVGLTPPPNYKRVCPVAR
jgi:hypothetical protein